MRENGYQKIRRQMTTNMVNIMNHDQYDRGYVNSQIVVAYGTGFTTLMLCHVMLPTPRFHLVSVFCQIYYSPSWRRFSHHKQTMHH